VRLPPITAFRVRLLTPHGLSGLPFGGLLGSDFLSRFGTVTIDFTHRRLVLGEQAPSGGRVLGIDVLRRAGGVSATTQVDLDKRKAQFVIDSGATISVIDSSLAAQLGLTPIGPAITATGAVCHAAVTPVAVRAWSIAGFRLSPSVIGRVPVVLPDPAIMGVLGTSTLARRGKLTIDFRQSRMILGGTGG
jgi:hypothetical protein